MNTENPTFPFAKIYKLISNVDETQFYTGSTTQRYLSSRKTQHIEAGKKKNSVLYIYLKSIDNNFRMELIENYPCNTMEELYQREEYYRKLLNPPLNEKKAYRTEEEAREYKVDYMKEYNKEYRAEHKDSEKARFKEYYEKNKDKMQARNKTDEAKEAKRRWAEANRDRQKEKVVCECGGEYSRSNKSQHLKSEQHQKFIGVEKIDTSFKDRNNQNAKQYYEANKEALKEKFKCECGGEYQKMSKAKHMNTKLHKDYESKNNL